MTHRLFVYGTLAPGECHADQLKDVPGCWEPAFIRGTLFRSGHGGVVRYPGVVLDPNGAQIRGLVFSSNYLVSHWSRLDEFEGDDYQRVVTTARLQGGSVIEAYVYALKARRTGP